VITINSVTTDSQSGSTRSEKLRTPFCLHTVRCPKLVPRVFLVQNRLNCRKVTKKVLVFQKVARGCSLTKNLLKILKVAEKLPSRIWIGLLVTFYTFMSQKQDQSAASALTFDTLSPSPAFNTPAPPPPTDMMARKPGAHLRDWVPV